MKSLEEKIYDFILANNIATERECNLVTHINGYSAMSLNDIIYARTGYHTVLQLLEFKPEFYKDVYNDFK